MTLSLDTCSKCIHNVFFKHHHWFLCRLNALYVASEVTTLIQRRTALRPTLWMNTTWPITCEFPRVQPLFVYVRACTIEIILWCHFSGSSWCTSSIKMRRSTLGRSVELFLCVYFFSPASSVCDSLFLCFRSRTCGRCTRSVAGTSIQLETVSGSNTRISCPSSPVRHAYAGIELQLLQHYLC